MTERFAKPCGGAVARAWARARNVAMLIHGVTWPQARVWLLACVLVATTWGACEMIGDHAIQHERDVALRDADGMVDDMAGEARDLAQAVDAVRSLAEFYVATRGEDTARDRQLAGEQMQRFIEHGLLGVTGVAVVDAGGWTVWATQQGAGRTFLGDRDYFQAARARDNETYFVAPLASRLTPGADRALAARALRSPDGGFAGEIVVSLDPKALETRLSRYLLRDYGSAGLLRTRDQVLLAHSASSPAMLELIGDPSRWGVGKPYGGAFHAAMRDQPEGHGRGLGGHTGRAKLVAWRQVAGTPLTVYVSVDEAEMLAETLARRQSLRSLALLFTVVVLAACIAGALARSASQREQARQRAEQAREAAEAADRDIRRLLSDLPAVVVEAVAGLDHARLVRTIGADPLSVVGCPVERVVDVPDFMAHVVPEDRPRFMAYREAMLRDGSGAVEVGWLRDDGRRITMAVQARVIGQAADGKHIVVTWADVTELARLRTQSAITGRLSALGEMATGIAHELNQPLAIISMAAENLLESLDEVPPELASARRRAERVMEQAIRASAVIDALLRFSDPQTRPPEPMCLADGWDAALRLIGGPLRRAGIEPQADIPSDLPAILATQAQIEQVLVNVVLNARDAMLQSPQRVPVLRLTAAATPDSVTLEIADNGGGIDEDVLTRIFEPFYTTKSPGAGPGLGLSICHGIMRTLGGDIAAHNAGDGAVITLTFRRADAVRPAALRTTPSYAAPAIAYRERRAG